MPVTLKKITNISNTFSISVTCLLLFSNLAQHYDNDCKSENNFYTMVNPMLELNIYIVEIYLLTIFWKMLQIL